MRIVICDDCREDALAVRKLLRGHDVRTYSGAEMLLADLEEKGMQSDLYLLDIFMEKSLNGIELAKRIRRVQEDAAICFVSSSDDFYREAYDLYAIQYLLKPVGEEAVKRLLDKVSKTLSENREQRLPFQFHGQPGSIPYGKILYINSREHSIYIHCTDGTVQECKGKLNELAVQVCRNTFMRCHQSFIVNMYRVDALKGMELTVGEEKIPVSRRYYAEVKRRYQEILFEEVD